MKIGLVTYFWPINYGAKLQAYALQRSLEALGIVCETINYNPQKNRSESWSAKNIPAKLFKCAVNLRYGRENNKGLERFQQFDSLFHLTQEFNDKPPFADLSDFDGFVCGSDQIWRNPNVGFYFLDFAQENQARVAYAPSFGISQIPTDQQSLYIERLGKFNSISVRETAGATIIRDLIGQDVPVVLDPTLLLNSDEWRSLEQEPSQKLPKEYVLNFSVQNTMGCFQVAKQAGKLLKLPVVSVDVSRRLALTPGTQKYYDLGPKEWLHVVDRASYVVTSSFHGTAFAINFRKPFITVCQEAHAQNTNSRMLSLSKLLGLEKRLVFSKAEITQDFLHCEYSDAVLQNLEAEQQKSRDYLAQAMEAVSK